MGIKSKSADQDGSTWTAPPDIFDPFAFPSIASRPIRSFPRSASNATQQRSKTFPRDARCGWMPPPHPTASILFAVLCLLFFLDSSCAFHAAPKYLLSTQYNTDVYIYMHAHLYEYTYTNSISMNTSEGLDRQIRRFPKSPLASRCRQERHITLKNSRINPEK